MDGQRADVGGQGAEVTAPFGTVTTAGVLEGGAGGPGGVPAWPVDVAALVVAQQDVIDRLVLVHGELRGTVTDLTRRIRRLEAGTGAPVSSPDRG